MKYYKLHFFAILISISFLACTNTESDFMESKLKAVQNLKEQYGVEIVITDPDLFTWESIDEIKSKLQRSFPKTTRGSSDFTQKYGYGLTFINMGVMGFVSIGFVMITGQAFNGPVLAALFTVVGFSANGKTVFNTLPILIGVLLASLGSKGSIFTLAISGLFGTALAPISGIFGPVAGIIAGWLHLAVVQNVGLVHGGLNLYNNGFSAGIVAGFLLPIFNMITDNNNQRKMNIQRKHMNFLKTVQANIKKRIHEKEDEEKK